MSGSERETAIYRRVSLRLIPLLFLSYIVAYLDRVNVGFAKLGMSSDLGFSDTVYGLGAGIFFIGYFVFEVPSNLILQRVGAKLWIARIMIVWGVVSAATMYVSSSGSFYAMRFLLGLAEAGFFPGVILYLTYWFPRAQRARMVAAFMTAIPVSGIIGGPISGWILGRMAGVSGLAGWQWLFLLEGLPSVLVGIWVLLRLDDGPHRARWLSDEERAVIQARLEEDEAVKREQGGGVTTFAGAFRDLRIWLLCLVYFGNTMGIYGLSFWLPQIIKDSITTDPVAIGLISALPWLAGGAAMLWTGHHSDLTGERRWHVSLGFLLAGVALAISSLPGIGGWAGLAALSVAMAGVLSATSCFWAIPTGILSGTAAAAGIAWINSVGNLAGYVSPTVIGRLRDLTHSMTPALVFLAASLGVAGVVTLIVTRTPSPVQAAPGKG